MLLLYAINSNLPQIERKYANLPNITNNFIPIEKDQEMKYDKLSTITNIPYKIYTGITLIILIILIIFYKKLSLAIKPLTIIIILLGLLCVLFQLISIFLFSEESQLLTMILSVSLFILILINSISILLFKHNNFKEPDTLQPIAKNYLYPISLILMLTSILFGCISSLIYLIFINQGYSNFNTYSYVFIAPCFIFIIFFILLRRFLINDIDSSNNYKIFHISTLLFIIYCIINSYIIVIKSSYYKNKLILQNEYNRILQQNLDDQSAQIGNIKQTAYQQLADNFIHNNDSYMSNLNQIKGSIDNTNKYEIIYNVINDPLQNMISNMSSVLDTVNAYKTTLTNRYNTLSYVNPNLDMVNLSQQVLLDNNLVNVMPASTLFSLLSYMTNNTLQSFVDNLTNISSSNTLFQNIFNKYQDTDISSLLNLNSNYNSPIMKFDHLECRSPMRYYDYVISPLVRHFLHDNEHFTNATSYTNLLNTYNILSSRPCDNNFIYHTGPRSLITKTYTLPKHNITALNVFNTTTDDSISQRNTMQINVSNTNTTNTSLNLSINLEMIKGSGPDNYIEQLYLSIPNMKINMPLYLKDYNDNHRLVQYFTAMNNSILTANVYVDNLHLNSIFTGQINTLRFDYLNNVMEFLTRNRNNHNRWSNFENNTCMQLNMQNGPTKWWQLNTAQVTNAKLLSHPDIEFVQNFKPINVVPKDDPNMTDVDVSTPPPSQSNVNTNVSNPIVMSITNSDPTIEVNNNTTKSTVIRTTITKVTTTTTLTQQQTVVKRRSFKGYYSLGYSMNLNQTNTTVGPYIKESDRYNAYLKLCSRIVSNTDTKNISYTLSAPDFLNNVDVSLRNYYNSFINVTKTSSINNITNLIIDIIDLDNMDCQLRYQVNRSRSQTTTVNEITTKIETIVTTTVDNGNNNPPTITTDITDTNTSSNTEPPQSVSSDWIYENNIIPQELLYTTPTIRINLSYSTANNFTITTSYSTNTKTTAFANYNPVSTTTTTLT